MLYLLLKLCICTRPKVTQKHYIECDMLCRNTSAHEPLNYDICVSMCDRMMEVKEYGIRNAVKSELLSGDMKVDNCGDRKDMQLMSDIGLRTLEIDTRYIIELLNDIEKTESKISKDNSIILILEAAIIVIYILKPCLMYFIQARFKAEAPHDGCRGGDVKDEGKNSSVLGVQDVIQAVDDIKDGFDAGSGKVSGKKVSSKVFSKVPACIEFV